MKRKVDFEAQLREGLIQCGESRYKIAQQSGVSNAQLSYFVNGQRSLSLAAASRLAETLGFELVKKKRKRKTR